MKRKPGYIQGLADAVMELVRDGCQAPTIEDILIQHQGKPLESISPAAKREAPRKMLEVRDCLEGMGGPYFIVVNHTYYTNPPVTEEDATRCLTAQGRYRRPAGIHVCTGVDDILLIANVRRNHGSGSGKNSKNIERVERAVYEGRLNLHTAEDIARACFRRQIPTKISCIPLIAAMQGAINAHDMLALKAA